MDPLFLETLATLETANGRKTIKGPNGEDSNNLFNIKDFSGKGYRAHDKAEGSNDAYRAYASREESTNDLLGLLSRKYPAALEATSARAFATALKAGGYATDPRYIDKFVSIFQQLDARGDSGPRQPVTVPARPAAAAGAPASAEPQGRSLDELYALAQGPRPPARMKLTATAKAAEKLAQIAPLSAPDHETDWFSRASDQAIASEKAKNAADQQGILDIARASVPGTLLGAAGMRLLRPSFEPDGTVATEGELTGYTTEEQDAIRDGSSAAERAQIRFELDYAKEQRKEAAKSGIGWALAGGLIAGAPEAIATQGIASLALASRGLGAVKLAEQGRRAAAAGSAVAENIGVGVSLTAAQDYLTPDIHVQDYVIGGIADSVGLALHAPRLLGAGRQVEADAITNILNDAVHDKADRIDNARAELGPDATPREVSQHAQRTQAAEIRTEVDGARGQLPADRQLFTDDVNAELMGEPVGMTEGNQSFDFPTLVNDAATADAVGVRPEHVNLPGNDDPVLSANILKEFVSETRRADIEAGRTPTIRNLDSGYDGKAAAALESAWSMRSPEGAAAIRDFGSRYGVDHSTLKRDAAPRTVTMLNAEGLHPKTEQIARWLQKTFLPDQRVVVMDMAATPEGAERGLNLHGDALEIGGDISVIRLRNDASWQHTLIHEFGHIIFNRGVTGVSNAAADGFRPLHAEWVRRYAGVGGKAADGLSRAEDAAVRRGMVGNELAAAAIGAKSPQGFNASLMDIVAGVVNRMTSDGPARIRDKHGALNYIPNIREFSAEQFTKYVEAAVADVLPSWKPADIPRSVIDYFIGLWAKFADFFNRVKQAGLIAPDARAVALFDEIRNSAKATDAARRLRGTLTMDKITADHLYSSDAMMSTPALAARSEADILRDHGLDTLPNSTPAQRAAVKAMVHLYRKAEAYPMPDATRMSKVLQKSPLKAVAPTALTLLSSKNPVARMLAAELIESGGGAGGRKQTAAVAKWLYEREFMGNALNDFQRHYKEWRAGNGGSVTQDFTNGKHFADFNRQVAIELENRLHQRESGASAAVRAAADVLTAGYDRMRVRQQTMKTPGWQALPETSEGYMPHQMSPGRIRAMTPAEGRVLHEALTEQFVNLEGFDLEFSQTLASKYIDTVRKRGTTGFSAPIGVQSSEAADIVEEAARAMGMTKDQADALAKRVKRAAPKHTKQRLRLDLTREYNVDGKPFTLLGLFETDQLGLLRSQAQRVSGEAALVRHGIMGSTGLKVLRQALDFGKASEKADNRTLEAFDQVASEFLGRPFGTQASPWLDRALQFNSLASLGGMGFNQLAETLNGAVTLGVRHALSAVGSFGRMRSEILALSKGQRVNNPIIGSIETYGGAEFGTDHYKMVFPFDRPGAGYEVYGRESLTAADRLLRAGSHLQGKLSLWRAITSAQERGMAEQIVHKALRYIRSGDEKVNVALADMGIDPGMVAAIRKDLDAAAKFDSRGRLTEFDITKLTDSAAADGFVQAVHRGARQIIQGAFIGETGAWAHSGWLKMLTQFRTFSLIAIDKQWNRQVGNHGTAAALGILLGTMSFAAPIVMVRAGLASLGRHDKDEYLAKRLGPANIARETLNYVALSGMAGDLLDALSAVSGVTPTGGRTGTNKSFAGNVVAPVIGKVNDVWGAIQNTRDGTDIHGVVQQLPFARLPWLYPAVNSLKDAR